MATFLWIIGLSVLSGVLYRLGGWKYGNKAIRRYGCPLVLLGVIWLLKGFNLDFW